MVTILKSSKDLVKLMKKGQVLLDFFATWCEPCHKLTSHLKELSKNYPKLNIIKIDIDKFNELAATFNINFVPTLIYLKNGKVIKTSSGYLPYKSLERIIK